MTQNENIWLSRRLMTLGITAAAATAAAVGRTDAQTNQSGDPTRVLAGKVALITGGPRNLGRAYAAGLAADGASIMIHYHDAGDRADAETAAHLVRAQGARAATIEGELHETPTHSRLVEATLREFGRIDILINNAGRMVKKPVAEISEAEYDDVFGVNAKASFFIMKEVSRHLPDGGRIINACSSLIDGYLPNYALYQGSKAALEQFTRSMARELGPHGVTVNAVAPGPIDTPFYRAPEDAAAIAYATRLSVAGRLGTVSDVVPLIRFLASPASHWVTGQTVYINGGYTGR
ncbi:SDR family oxidoreductase [Bradyrhizobium sp. NBAIM32]|uniref:SDR family oxidoreductase n=1 Tax=Bradyrhizobium sp. NBAIM32 TaxID=2793809 RepID=UPI001CD34652|nr:SDR family oxidoreductase [Bradyrhizobium sp. NBAIM32]MCA1541704.1 SDR family oxidoreductase [Bradyrhizobium sp. NBAIM32]